MGAARLSAVLTDPASVHEPGRGFALIDPSSRRHDWLIRTSLEGRRSKLPYAGYAQALARMTARS